MNIKDVEQLIPYLAFIILVFGSLVAYLNGIMPGEMFGGVLGSVISYVCTRDRGNSTGNERTTVTLETPPIEKEPD